MKGARAFLWYKRELLQLLADRQPRLEVGEVAANLPLPSGMDKWVRQEASGGAAGRRGWSCVCGWGGGSCAACLAAVVQGRARTAARCPACVWHAAAARLPALQPPHPTSALPPPPSCSLTLPCPALLQAEADLPRFVGKFMGEVVAVAQAGQALLLELRPFPVEGGGRERRKAPTFRGHCKAFFRHKGGCKYGDACYHSHAGERQWGD